MRRRRGRQFVLWSNKWSLPYVARGPQDLGPASAAECRAASRPLLKRLL